MVQSMQKAYHGIKESYATNDFKKLHFNEKLGRIQD